MAQKSKKKTTSKTAPAKKPAAINPPLPSFDEFRRTIATDAAKRLVPVFECLDAFVDAIRPQLDSTATDEADALKAEIEKLVKGTGRKHGK